MKTLQEEINKLEKEVQNATEEWNSAQLNRDPIKTKYWETQLVQLQSQLEALKMRRRV